MTFSAAHARAAQGNVFVLTPPGPARRCQLALLAVAPSQELLRAGAAGVFRTAPVADFRPL
eukprot:13513304-Alexandrium_andersonii.AAC.1